MGEGSPHLELCTCRLGVAEGVDDLALGARELGRALKVRERLGHFALLQQELRHGRDGDVALGVN